MIGFLTRNAFWLELNNNRLKLRGSIYADSMGDS